ncbi:MAG TPA: branched-chain amino acid ABC transporter permease [Syntrophales bacterium]|nr:branched-chain amino acid ABC transporter permease [Syntrophales bacterium]HPI57054.1 branched-chain amino acid ABC transporter permease [Syntrophales bacterium]HPN23816.1 branched-chain amino acid ABC transporter permease [Syntrophales bacterium]
MDLLLHLLVVIAIYAVFALSLNVEVGYTGLFNFGHVAFFAVGAYTSALLTLAGTPFLWSLPAALAAAGLCGFLLGIPALKLQGDYFGIATLGFGEILRMIFINEVWLTKGPMGLPGIPRPELFGFVFDTLPRYLALSAAATLATFAILAFVVLSPFGRALRAVRDDETAAEILGKNAYAFKIKSFVLGSVFAGLAGVLWAHYVTFISPGDFTLTETILVLLIVVMGGKGTLWGPLVGAVTLIVFQESVRYLRLPPEWTRLLGPLQQMVFGLLLVALMVFRPGGIVREKGERRGD